MHISLDQAIGRQPRLNRVGQSLLNIASGASAAYSLRSLTGDEPKAVRIRRDGDNEERDFTTAEIGNEAADWTNGKQETTLPADVATSAAAYSLRKVKSDYTGPAVRVRRTSDDIDADVAFDTNDTVSNDSIVTEVLSGNQSTLQAFISGTNAAVAIWYDQSGSSNNATQEADANQPLIASGGNLRDDGIEFESDVQLLLSGSGLDIFKNAPNGHIFSVIKPGEQGTSNKRYFEALTADGSGARFLFGDGQDVNATFRIGGRSLDSDSFGDEESPTSPNGALSVMTGFLDYQNAEGFLFLNGTQVATNTIPNISGSNTSNTSSNKVAIGAATASLTADFFAKEFIIYNTDQTNNRFKIESNINNHYTIYTAAQNGFVNKWYDQSGNGRNAVAAADENEPKIVENGSYLGELSFDGSDDTLSVATVSTLGIDGSNNKSAFAVARTTAGTDGFVIAGIDGGGSFRGLRYRSNATNGQARVEISSFGVQGGDLSDGNNHVYSSIFDGTQTQHFDVSLDGSITQGSGTDVVNTDGTSTFFIGTVTSNSDAGFTREFILYASDQTSNRTAIETNIANEYGITLS